MDRPGPVAVEHDAVKRASVREGDVGMIGRALPVMRLRGPDGPVARHQRSLLAVEQCIGTGFDKNSRSVEGLRKRRPPILDPAVDMPGSGEIGAQGHSEQAGHDRDPGHGTQGGV